MKIITLLPVKNEAWILPYSLKNFSDFSDYIIVADQNSTDETLQICAQFPKVKVIKNSYQGHSNKIRWDLLNEARKIEGENNLIVCLDADELISPDFINEIQNNKARAFSSSWLQLFQDEKHYRCDGVWENNKKQFCFIDDRTVDYPKNEVINDHTGRTPHIEVVKEIDYPILHLQYLAQKRCQIKQAWYMCQEFIKSQEARKINLKYSVAKFSGSINTKVLEDEWIKHINLPISDIFQTYDKDRLFEIQNMFKEHGVSFFEHLDIWYIDELKELFIRECKRNPKPKFFPKWLILLNNLKNKLK